MAVPFGSRTDARANEGETTMMNAVRANAARPSGARGLFASQILMLALAVMLTPAFGAAPSAPDVAKANPRLASLQIEIWPDLPRTRVGKVLKNEIKAQLLPASGQGQAAPGP